MLRAAPHQRCAGAPGGSWPGAGAGPGAAAGAAAGPCHHQGAGIVLGAPGCLPPPRRCPFAANIDVALRMPTPLSLGIPDFPAPLQALALRRCAATFASPSPAFPCSSPVPRDPWWSRAFEGLGQREGAEAACDGALSVLNERRGGGRGRGLGAAGRGGRRIPALGARDRRSSELGKDLRAHRARPARGSRAAPERLPQR